MTTRPLWRLVKTLLKEHAVASLTIGILVGVSVAAVACRVDQSNATLKGHSGVVWSVAFSPDGRVLASGSEDCTVRIWNVSDWKTRVTLRGHRRAVTSVAFQPSGTNLASGSDDGEIVLWSTETWERVRRVSDQRGGICCLVFSPNGIRLAAGHDSGAVAIYDVASLKLLRVLEYRCSRQVSLSLGFSPDSRYLYAAGLDATRYDMTDGKESDLTDSSWVETSAMNALAVSPTGRFIATGDFLGHVSLWNINGEIRIARCGSFVSPVGCLCFSPDGRFLAAGPWGHRWLTPISISVWDVASQHAVASLKGHWERVTSVAFSPDGRYLASSSTDGTIKIWQQDQWERELKRGRS